MADCLGARSRAEATRWGRGYQTPGNPRGSGFPVVQSFLLVVPSLLQTHRNHRETEKITRKTEPVTSTRHPSLRVRHGRVVQGCEGLALTWTLKNKAGILAGI